MQCAAYGGNVAELEWLAAQGAVIAAVDVIGWSTMHTAIHKGQVAAAEWLEKQIDELSTLRVFTNFELPPQADSRHYAYCGASDEASHEAGQESSEHRPIGACSCGH
jgi:hypothetical protein